MARARDINPERIEAVRSLAQTAANALRRARVRMEAGMLEEAIADLGTRRKARWLRGLKLIVAMCHPRCLAEILPPGKGIEGRDWLDLNDTLDRRCRRLIRELEGNASQNKVATRTQRWKRHKPYRPYRQDMRLRD